jgi:hypothetical protein
VVRPGGLLKALLGTFAKDPAFTPQIILHVGLPNLVDWLGHVTAMFLYAAASKLSEGEGGYAGSAKERFLRQTQLDAWKYGSGEDFKFD